MPQPNVLRKVKIDGAWKLLPVSKKNGKLDWPNVDLKGVPIPSLKGTFYLEYRENGRRVRRAVGDHPRDAKQALATQGNVLSLRESGMAVEDAPEIQSYRPVSGPRIREVVADYIANPPAKLRSTKSRAKYFNALRAFERWTTRTHVSQLGRQDIMAFMAYLMDAEKLDPSTAIDKAVVAHAVMNDRGAEIRMKRGDWPKVTRKERKVYEPHVLQQLFAAATPDEYALFQTFLQTGFREQEVGYLCWDDFNPRNNTLRVSEKKGLGFRPKTYQERTIPIPDELVDILQAHRKRQGGGSTGNLIFPTTEWNAKQGRPGGQRDRHMLDRLKRLALRAGLNCGRCETTLGRKPASCKDKPVCENFGLHMFRHTYATTMLHDGVDIVSVQKLLGHSDLESTRQYLRALQPVDLLAKIRRTSIASRFVRVA